MTVLDSSFGAKLETVYGTPVVVDRFWEIESVPSFTPDFVTVESSGHQAGIYGTRKGRSRRVIIGASGGAPMPVPTRGFGWWLKPMMGSLVTGAATDSNYPHTGTIASIYGTSFTAQLGRPLVPGGTVEPYTYEGGKVASWEMSIDVDGHLMVTLTCDFEDVKNADQGGQALAAPGYASGATVFDFTGATVTIGGVSAEMKNVKFGIDNRLNTGRRFLGARVKKEPTTAGPPVVTWSGELEFKSNAEYNKVVDADAADNYAAIVITFTGPIAHAGTTLPTLVVTIPEARFDDHSFSTSLSENLSQTVGGVGHVPTAGGSAMTIVYTTADATA